jgi:hypothetical protein
MNFYPTFDRPTEYGLSRQERQHNLMCQRAHRDDWVVTMRNFNMSAFNGYHHTSSDYSELVCLECGRRWRTKARYVRHLPDSGSRGETG